MSHFAQVDEDNYVVQVLVGDNNLPDEGYSWFVENFGGRWIQTSYNNKIRKNFASVGYRYDEELDAFIAPKPYAGWTLNKETCKWEAPIEYPNDGLDYYWSDETRNWELPSAE